LVKKDGLHKAFHVGGTSSCRQHIRRHYALYSERCEEAGIKENHWAVPQNVWRERQADKNEKLKTGKHQLSLDGVFVKTGPPKVFLRQDILETVARFVVSDDQVSVESFKMFESVY
jgi:hypothetical protein